MRVDSNLLDKVEEEGVGWAGLCAGAHHSTHTHALLLAPGVKARAREIE